MRIALGFMAAAALLAGCAPVAGDSAGSAMTSCDTERARGIVGQQATPARVEEARKAAGAGTVRVIEPGMMVTMEYRADRLNIDVDERKVATDVRCG